MLQEVTDINDGVHLIETENIAWLKRVPLEGTDDASQYRYDMVFVADEKFIPLSLESSHEFEFMAQAVKLNKAEHMAVEQPLTIEGV